MRPLARRPRIPRVLRYAEISRADPSVVWTLLARPDRWSAWAPHVRGAWHLGSPQVREGARGAARLMGVIPVPARITAVDPGRSWTWQVGPVSMRHTVDPAPQGSEVGVTLMSSGPVEAVLAKTYGPIVQLLVTRLARVAEERVTVGP